MASVFTHSFLGLALGKIFTGAAMPARFWVLAALCGALPDADAIGHMLGVRYSSMWGHRGITHSILFALLVGFAITLLAFGDTRRFSREWWGLVLFFTLATISHSVLDAMTTGGLGVAFFAPFDNSRYFFPWRPIQVSPIGVKAFFSEWGLRVIKSEFIWVWVPSLIAILIAWGIRKWVR